MARPLSSYDYRCFLDDPDLLEVPVNFVTRPLPALVKPDAMPSVTVPASRDTEPLVALEHRRIRILSSYWHAGWGSALPGAFMRAGAAARLIAVVDGLPDGFGLGVLDAWRPLGLQAEIYEAAYSDINLPAGFVLPPSTDPATPPPHLTGGTVDVTLTWQGGPLAIGSSFDDFTDESHTDAYEHVPGRVRQLRRLLYWSMSAQGFVVLPQEWWHFETGTRMWAAVTGELPQYGAASPA